MNYIIRKDNHFGFHLPRLQYNLKKLNFNVLVDKNCEYHLGDNDQYDINKLYGISWGLHHKNSFRIGWTYDELEHAIKLFLYTYNNSVRSWDYLCTIPLEYKLKFNITFTRENNIIVIKWLDKTEIIYFEFPEKKWGYYLWPYFGGNKKAPHNITIKLQQL